MRWTNPRLALFAFLLLAACGGGGGPSGVDSSKALRATTADERVLLCDYWDSLYMGETRIATSCPMGSSSQTGGSREQCESTVAGFDAACTATVGEFETCIEAAEADPCVVYDSAICPDSVIRCF
jgi:hypothetical protein